jgi:hypothetical protein
MTPGFDRRRFLTLLGATTAAVALPATAAEAAPRVITGGADLTGWETVVGDGVYALPGQDPVTAADIAVDRNRLLRANIQHRGIAAHVLAFKRITDVATMTSRHHAVYQFRLPTLPATGAEFNGQTVEGGLFVWDGANTRLDYGTAFQWIVNPWLPECGQINVWADEAWVPAGFLKPDTAWHTARFLVAPDVRKARLAIDRTHFDVPYSQTTKDGWGTDTSARLQVEAVSLWPNAANPSTPEHRVQVRNWAWTRKG